jgi:hypothetical protein
MNLPEVQIKMSDHHADIAVALKKTDTSIFRHHVEESAAFLSLQGSDC